MKNSLNFTTMIQASLLLLGFASFVQAQQSFLAELEAVHDPARRSDKALMFADAAFDNAREFYSKGEIKKGDAELENMTNALKECVGSLQVAHKARFYKRAELKVAYLQRRMQGLLDDVSVQQRGWVEYTQRKLDEIHDKLLEGVMRK
jgi:type II secretory pathway component PulJ